VCVCAAAISRATASPAATVACSHTTPACNIRTVSHWSFTITQFQNTILKWYIYCTILIPCHMKIDSLFFGRWQLISCELSQQNVHHHFHNSQLLDPNLCKTKSVHLVTPNLFKICCNINTVTTVLSFWVFCLKLAYVYHRLLHVIFSVLANLTIFNEKGKLWNSLMCNFLHLSAISILQVLVISVCTLLSTALIRSVYFARRNMSVAEVACQYRWRF
jgi:hypothetical protein